MIPFLMAAVRLGASAVFDADDLLQREGYVRSHKQWEWFGQWHDSSTSIYTRHSPLGDRTASPPYDASKNETPELGRRRWFLSTRMNGAWHFDQETWKSFTGLPLGHHKFPPLRFDRGNTCSIWAFSPKDVVYTSHGDQSRVDSQNPYPQELRMLLESWVRWRLSHVEMAASNEESLAAKTLTRILNDQRDFISIRDYAEARGYKATSELSESILHFSHSNGTLFTVYVGSDAVRVNGEDMYTDDIHPAVGKEVFLPADFLKQHQL